MSPPKASDTHVLWNAVGKLPVDESLNKMKQDGWVPVAEDSQTIILQYRCKRATLYLANGKVGMVQVDDAAMNRD